MRSRDLRRVALALRGFDPGRESSSPPLKRWATRVWRGGGRVAEDAGGDAWRLRAPFGLPATHKGWRYIGVEISRPPQEVALHWC